VFSTPPLYQGSMESVIQSSCLECVQRPDRLFCDLPPSVLQEFDLIKSVNQVARGTVLFREGHPSRGVFVLCGGRARLTVCSDGGKRLLLRIAGPGEVLGLSASLSGSAYEVTAEVTDDAKVAVVKRKDLLRFLRHHREACLRVVNLLSQDLHLAYDRVRSVGLGRSRRCRTQQVQ
jgi:CRP/FNR family transcriptional regulator